MELVRWSVGALASVWLLMGCATKVDLDVAHAPKLRIAGVKSIKIDVFRPLPNCLHEYPAAVRVVNEFPSYVRRALSSGAFQVVESENFDARLTGEISCRLLETVDSENVKQRDGKIVQQYKASRRADLLVTFSLLDRSGNVMGSSRVRENASNDSGRGSTQGEALYSGQFLDKVIETAMISTATQLLQAISPYVVKERFSFEDGDAGVVKDGIAAAEKGNWQEAARLWNVGLQSSKEADQIASLYNLAIYDEFAGKLDEAQQKYEQVFVRKQEPRYHRALMRIRARVEEEKWLRVHFGGK